MICKKCSKELEQINFYSRENYSKTGLRFDSTCKKCRNIESMERHDPVERYKKELPKRFGITWEEYLKFYNNQNGCCAICKSFIKVNGEHTNRLEVGFVDHNHITGEVRGLLCSQCNMALGLFKESSEILEAASKYLNENNC